MDIKQLQYLVVSIDNGSFKKASELLYTTQPHISKTIKSLEVELGMQLLKRNARGVEATEEGRKVYEYACRILVDSGKIQFLPPAGGVHKSFRILQRYDILKLTAFRSQIKDKRCFLWQV